MADVTQRQAVWSELAAAGAWDRLRAQQRLTRTDGAESLPRYRATAR
jgi:hypothetical protein